MKRWLVLFLSIGLLGMLSEGDASFGGAAAMRDGCVRIHDYIQREHGDQLNQFWQDYAPDFNKPLKSNVVIADYAPKPKKQRIGIGFFGLGDRFKRPENRLKKHKKSMKPVYAKPCVEPVQEIVMVQQPIKQEQPSATDAVAALAQVLADKISQVETRITQKSDDRLEAFAERIERAVTKKKKKKYMPEMHHAQSAQPAMAPQMNYAQPAMPQQPVYQQPVMQQNNMQQTAACAMQLQASAMAMQAQASAMMMQAQQQAVPVVQQPQYSVPLQNFVMPRSNITQLSKQEKVNQLMQILQYMASTCGQDMHRLLLLLDTECDIIEQLLARATGQGIDTLVAERNASLRKSNPMLSRAHELIIDLAATTEKNEGDTRLYHYFIRRNSRAKESHSAAGQKKFLMQMMYQLERYYQMIEKMQNAVSEQ